MSEARQSDGVTLAATDLVEGGPGGLFAEPRHIRSDARLAVRLLRLGVFPEDQVETLLQALGQQLAHAAEMVPDGDAPADADGQQPLKPRSTRNYVALMKLWVQLAKLEASQYPPPPRVLTQRTRIESTQTGPDGTVTTRQTEVASLAADLGITLDH